MKRYKKEDFPVEKIRRFLEPGPVVLVSSAHDGEQDIMTMGWHMILGDGPSLVGCFIWDQNHSRELIHASQECVINLPTFDLIDAVIGVGNTHGPEVDKFEEFGLTPGKAKKVAAPLIEECYANFECKLVDDSQVEQVQPVHLRVREGPRRHVAQVSEDGPLPRGRGVHDLGREQELPAEVQTWESVRDETRW